MSATQKQANGFVVYAGSQAVLEHRASAKSMKAKREKLIEKGHSVQENDHLVFTKDIEFGSPSTAGSVVRGGNTNCLLSWKNCSGKQLKEIANNT